jgi:hypothetical protein
MKRKQALHDELRDFALDGAREKIRQILRLFPELRDEITGNDSAPAAAAPDVPLTPAQKRLKKHALAHWHSTNGSASVKGLSLATALRKVLSEQPRTNSELQALLHEQGYKHSGSTSMSQRVSQEMRELVTKKIAKRIKASGKGRDKFAWSSNQGGE